MTTARTPYTRPTADAQPVKPVAKPGLDDQTKTAIRNKITVERYSKLDIRSVGNNRYRVNVWAEEKSGEFDVVKCQKIVQSFYHTQQ